MHFLVMGNSSSHSSAYITALKIARVLITTARVLLAAHDGREGLALKMCEPTAHRLFLSIVLLFLLLFSLYHVLVSDFIKDREAPWSS